MRVRAAVPFVLIVLAGCGGSKTSDDGGGPVHGGLTLKQAKVQAADDGCPGPAPRITRCEPRGDAWRCYDDEGGYSTVERIGPGDETATLC